ncbi:MAG TPA: hypothetical protein VFY69_01475 [Solirubrobacterales bacterium]|nr:hypothetical protein [Solirubrobacterales bacterium]
MSSIAVFLVLGGATAIAAGLAKNSVGPKQLKKNAVTTKKIKNNAVTTSKIRNGAVTASKLAPGTVSSGLGAGSVTNDKLAEGAVTGNKIATGTIGRGNLAEGALLPRGIAFVDFTGQVNPAASINIPNATNPVEGIFCFDLPYQPLNAQVTVEGDTEPNDYASVVIPGAGDESLFECPVGTELEVQVFEVEPEGPEEGFTDEEFFLVVW